MHLIDIISQLGYENNVKSLEFEYFKELLKVCLIINFTIMLYALISVSILVMILLLTPLIIQIINTKNILNYATSSIGILVNILISAYNIILNFKAFRD